MASQFKFAQDLVVGGLGVFMFDLGPWVCGGGHEPWRGSWCVVGSWGLQLAIIGWLPASGTRPDGYRGVAQEGAAGEPRILIDWAGPYLDFVNREWFTYGDRVSKIDMFEAFQVVIF